MNEQTKYARANNGLRQTKFRPVPVINQKNYFTEYLKRDSHFLANMKRGDEEQETDPAKVVVLHPGSRNLRIGFASDFIPKVVPMVVAKKAKESSSERPWDPVDEVYEEVLAEVKSDFKDRMKFYKRRVVSNGDEIVSAFNKRQEGEKTVDDDLLSDATGPEVFGDDALSLDSSYTLWWPIANGELNEQAYSSPQALLGDLAKVINAAIAHIGIHNPGDYSVMLLIPDLFEQPYVEAFVEVLLRQLQFARVALLQESVAATFGVGVSSACVVDVGAQSTSISCVDEGMALTDSRVNLKFGGDDITVAFARMLAAHNLPGDLKISDKWDWKLLDDLKIKYCTTNDADMAVQLYSFYRRRPGEATMKFSFKTFDEVMLPILGLFYPTLFGHAHKLSNRFALFPQRENPYESTTNLALSDAMINMSLNLLAVFGESYRVKYTAESTPNEVKEETVEPVDEKTEASSTINSPSRQGTPAGETAQAKAAQQKALAQQQSQMQLNLANKMDLRKVLVTPLDHAIIESIAQAAIHTGTSPATFYENIMVVGGGAEFVGFHGLLADRLGMWLQNKDVGELSVMALPRDLRADHTSWKGGSVYTQLKIAEEMWISQEEWDILGSRILQNRSIFFY